jgi:methylglutaconyl-CoA hydratase
MSDRDEKVLFHSSAGGVSFVTINRPDKRNAFDAETIDRLHDIFETLNGADHEQCVVIGGVGSTFCAGADLHWMKEAAENDFADNERDAYRLAEMLHALYNLPQLTLCAVKGAAMGGGAGLVAACDVAIAVKGTRFAFSEVKLGLTPATISPFVIRAIGPRAARALFATAEGFDADHAERLGLVQFVVEDDAALDQEIERLVAASFLTAPGAVAAAKALVDDVTGRPLDHALMRFTAKAIAERRASSEGKEGLCAFLEKRSPEW